MSANSTDRPEIVQTDAEGQETGAQHGQTPTGAETGSSAPDEGSASQPPTGERTAEGTGEGAAERTGEGTGAQAGEYS